MWHKINWVAVLLSAALCAWGQPAAYTWTSPSRNSSESMPCGGGDIGLNVWVEGGDLLFYVSRSGTFDENNTLLKQGRVRVHVGSDPFTGADDFRQTLHLEEGYVSVSAGETVLRLWVDVYHPVVHVSMESKKPEMWQVSYESWRYEDRLLRKGEGQQCSYKWAPPKGTVTRRDSIFRAGGRLYFLHHNKNHTVFDFSVAQQGLQGVKDRLADPLRNLASGGCLWGDNLTFRGTSRGVYAGTDYRSWDFGSRCAKRKDSFCIALQTEQVADAAAWKENLDRVCRNIRQKEDKTRSREWWKQFWQRSFIEADGEAAGLARNYTLFRYMLGCNAYGSYPTKFNGSLFTFDPCYVDEKQSFTPDFRQWGGGTMTAQNQRLVYWPMLKSGDADMMKAQFDTYLRMLSNAEMRSVVYWGHAGACFTEQIENYGLPNPAEYGYKRPSGFDPGVEYNAWLEYEWDTVLEFCQMILEAHSYAGADITPYLPLIDSALAFFDEHYRYLARERGVKELDGDGKLVLYPGSAGETYKMAYNASSTVAALKRVLATYGKRPDFEKRLPEIPLRMLGDKQAIAPAVAWARVNNVESPQLYPVFPWRFYGVGREGLDIARNTYWEDADAVKFRSHVGWKQDNIWAACLGLTEEAARLNRLKLSDSSHRFPAFWGPGFDWTPDHNWGGSGMIGLQEMLLQTVGDRILLFPSWPVRWNVHFKLHAQGQTTVEAMLKDGKVSIIDVSPSERRKDIEIMIKP